MTGTETFHLADLFEAVADAVGDRVAVVAGDRRLTYAELEDRSNRLADHLRWDLADELHRLFGPGPAQALATLAAGARQALSSLARRAAEAVGRGGAAA